VNEQTSLPTTEPAAPPSAKGGVRAAAREIVETIILTLLIFLAVRSVIQNFKVEGASMEPGLESGQYLLVNKAVYFSVDTDPIAGMVPFLPRANGHPAFVFQEPQRGDVVVFHYPRDPSRDFIKRVIAVPGETVDVRNGRVFVNGQVLSEPYEKEPPAYTYGPLKLGPDEYFVLGDNRNNSSDSHVWGAVPRANIVGKAWLRYWPVNEWGVAPNYTVEAHAAP
jgi:signal peptidase I